MKKVSLDKFSEYPFKFSAPRHLFHKNAHFFYPKPLFIVTLVFLFLISLFKTSMLKLFFPLLGIYLYQFLIVKRLKNNIQLKRMLPEKSKEDATEIFHYEISNANPFSYKNTLVFDFNNISSDQEYFKLFFHELHAQEKLKTQLSVKMNNGMGKKTIGPLVMFLTDSLGIHRLTFTNDFKHQVKVFPKVLPTNSPRMNPDLTNINFGEFDTYRKGNNVNFYSTKEYQEGDSVNHINWKLSLKSNKLIVNEFESNTNAKIVTVLIDDDRIHFGEGKDSSLEICKDLILSLLHANVRSNNDLGFISHQKFIKPDHGKQHLNALELFISSFELNVFDKTSIYSKKTISKGPMEKFARKILFHTNFESNIFIFTGLVPGRVWDVYLAEILRIRKRVQSIHLVIVHGYKLIIHQAADLDRPWLTKLSAKARQEIEQIKEKCQSQGIVCSFVSMDARVKYKRKIREGFHDARI